MLKYVQVDRGTVTGWLETKSPPLILPDGRIFVEVQEFPPLGSTMDEKGGFTPPIEVPPPPNPLDEIKTKLEEILAKVSTP